MILPRFASEGFKVMDAPKELWQRLRANYQAHKNTPNIENFPNGHLHVDEAHKPRFIGNAEQQRLNDEVTAALKPICEAWSNVSLIPTSTYGVRVYTNGSTLFMHADTAGTHIISAILHIDDDLDEPWPLEIEDHQGKLHALSLQPGQMVLYESATQFHSRSCPISIETLL